MSAFNMGEKLCKEYGCLCAACEHRHTSFKKCETSCLCCDPDMPLDSFEYDTEEYQNARVIPGRRRQSR